LVMPCSFLRRAGDRGGIGTCARPPPCAGTWTALRPAVVACCARDRRLHRRRSVAVAAPAGLPMLDADGMGRAFRHVPGVDAPAGVALEPWSWRRARSCVPCTRARLGRADGAPWSSASRPGLSSEYLMTVARSRRGHQAHRQGAGASRADRPGRVVRRGAGRPSPSSTAADSPRAGRRGAAERPAPRPRPSRHRSTAAARCAGIATSTWP